MTTKIHVTQKDIDVTKKWMKENSLPDDYYHPCVNPISLAIQRTRKYPVCVFSYGVTKRTNTGTVILNLPLAVLDKCPRGENMYKNSTLDGPFSFNLEI